MSQFKIEANIPIPDRALEGPQDALESEPEPEPDDPLPPEEPSRWVPYKPNQRKCSNSQHYPPVGKCQRCGDIFPCPSGNCGHLDCADPSLVGLDCPGNGTEIPEFLNVIEPQDPLARAEYAIEVQEVGSDED